MAFRRKFLSIHLHEGSNGERFFIALASDGTAWSSKALTSGDGSKDAPQGIQVDHWVQIAALPDGRE